MAFLELKNIRKSYWLGKEEFPVLKGLDLQCDLGEFVSILGESGGGKSTLMNIIGGLDCAFDGTVSVNGRVLDHRDEREMNHYRRQTVGYIYQDYNLIGYLTVLDNVMAALDMTTLTRRQREERAKKLLARFGLAQHMKKYPNQLSGGQKQRVAIVRALAPDPQIIIADEPTGALDSSNTEEVLKILQDIAKEGKLVIAVTHSQAVADAGTRIVRLEDGVLGEQTLLHPEWERTAIDHGQMPSADVIESKPLPASAAVSMANKHFWRYFGRNFLIVLGTAIGLMAVMLFSGLGNGISGYIAQQVNNVANPRIIRVTRYVKPSTDSSGSSASSSSSSSTGSASQNSQSQQMSDNMSAMQALAQGKLQQITPAMMNSIASVKGLSSTEGYYTATSATLQQGSTQIALQSLSNWTNMYSASTLVAGKAPRPGQIVVDKAQVAQVLEGDSNWKSIIGKQLSVTMSAVNASTGRPTTATFDVTVSGVAESSAGLKINALNTQTMKDELAAMGASTDPIMVIAAAKNYNDATNISNAINGLKNSDGSRQFEALSLASVISTVQTYVHLASVVLASIAAIALVVSALMIIVTMYMSVSERTKEIGVLRALGGSKHDIRLLFLSESLIIGLLSAALGTGLAFGIGAGINSALEKIAKYSFVAISGQNVLVVFIVAIVLALLAAVLPARHAASLNPIDALAAD